MERRFGNQSPFRISSPENYHPTDRNAPTFDQTLESSLSGLTLSSTPPFKPDCFNGVDSRFDSISGEGYLPIPFQSNAKFQRLRVRNGVDDQMGLGYGGADGNRAVGPWSWEGFQIGSYPTAESEPWQTYDGLNSSFGFNQGLGLVCESGSGSHINKPYTHNFFDSTLIQLLERSSLNQNHCGSFLQPKKQWGNQLNSQIQLVPCFNKNNFPINSDQHFDAFLALNSHNLNSQCLHQFPNLLNCYSLENLRGQIACLAKDQYGSRLLQTKFEDPKEEELEMVLLEVIDHLGDLMRDQFGNYIIQKLVKVCNEKQRTLMILAITKTQFQLISICLNPHGTRVVQRLLEHITSQQQISLVLSALSPGALVLATDSNGHHVIQHCLIHFSNEDNQFLLIRIKDNCFKVATNKHGCCVLQSCVDHFQGEYRESLVAEIIENAIHLAEDPYGNYVVQHLLGLRMPGVTENLVKQLKGSFVYLSCSKYASNVVEKCLTEAGQEESSQIVMEFLRSPNVLMLLVDPFGNFVIQSALSVSKGIIRSALFNIIRRNASTLRTNLYGKKVLDRFNKIMSQLA